MTETAFKGRVNCVPTGTYLATAVSATQFVGSPPLIGIVMDLEISGIFLGFKAPPLASSYDGSVVRARSPMLDMRDPMNIAVFIRFVNAFGINEQILRELGRTNDLTSLADALVNRRAIVELDHRHWNAANVNLQAKFRPVPKPPPLVEPHICTCGTVTS